MKFVWATMLLIAFMIRSTQAQQEKSPRQSDQKAMPSQTKKSETTKEGSTQESAKFSKVTVLSEDELKKLLEARVNGALDGTFRDFGNMFFVKSKIEIGTAIGIMGDDKEIVRSNLQSTFPESYHPTLRELLDAIALQTFSEWKYNPESQRVQKFEPDNQPAQTDKAQDEPVKGIALFDFKRTTRKKPFTVKMAEDWKSEDKGTWVMYIPPDFPVGMDIYEFGQYSTKNDDKKSFFEKIRGDVALEWAQRVNPEAKAEDLKPMKVGKYDALFYEKLLKGNGNKIRWRHWVFTVEDRCFFIVSTILPRLDDEIFPDVVSMIASFRLEDKVVSEPLPPLGK